MKSYDVIIIGAGSAGLSARQQVARKTQSYLVIDQGPLGTTCARAGCMPSKAFIEVAELFHASTILTKNKLQKKSNINIETERVMKHVRTLRDRFVASVLKDMKSWQKTHFRKSRAHLVGVSEGHYLVEVDGREVLRAKRLILAVGTKPKWMRVGSGPRPAFGKKLAARLVDSDSFFEQKSLSRKVAVLGLGAIGLELADAMSKIGIEVVAIGDTKKVGGLSDPELIREALRIFKNRFEIKKAMIQDVKLEHSGVKLIFKGTSMSVPQALVALGREPGFKEMGLESLGIALNERGLPEIDASRFQIPGHEIFVIGDANQVRPLLHEAVDQGRFVGALCTGQRSEVFHPKTPLRICFTSPQIVSVGTSILKLKQDKVLHIEGSVSFKIQGRALTKLKNQGKLKIYACPKTGILLGAEMIGPEAEHLGHLIAWAMDEKAKVKDLLRKTYYHPSLEEGLRSALRMALTQIKEKTDAADDALREEPVAGTHCP